MPKIFVATVDNARDRTDFEKSVLRPVERQAIISNFSDATYPELIDIERRGRGFYAWGLKSSPENVQNWFVAGVGDLLLIGYKGSYRHYAKVLGRYENSSAAKEIWGDDTPDEDLREYMFFLSEPITIGLPYEDLADHLPTSYQEFQQIDETVSNHINTEFGTLERFARKRLLNTAAGGPILDMSGMIQLSEQELSRLQMFDPQSSKEGRTKIIEDLIKRRGHPALRQALLTAYEARCAISNFNAVDTLEAAYIVPYRGKYTHDATNGILLRSDLHALFDMGKIAIDTRTMSIIMADELMDTSYRLLAGRPLRYPKEEGQRPSTEALDLHRKLAGL